MDFSTINAAALGRADALLEFWLPGGHFGGDEYTACNPTREDRNPGSFKVNRRTFKWADFATGDKGGDAVSLVAYLRGLSQGEAARRLAEELGLGLNNARNENGNRKPDLSYEIRNVAGELVATHHRFEGQNGKRKKFIWERDGKWKLDRPVTALPLYGAERTRGWPDDSSVILTEGEKCSEHLWRLGLRALGTVCGSGKVPDDAQLGILTHFREIILWPDHDDVGDKHMRGIAARLLALGVTRDRLKWLDSVRVEGLSETGGGLRQLGRRCGARRSRRGCQRHS